MTRRGVREYIEAIRQRYRGGDKGEKGKILDEAAKVTGYHRKALIRLLGSLHAPVKLRGAWWQHEEAEASALAFRPYSGSLCYIIAI